MSRSATTPTTRFFARRWVVTLLWALVFAPTALVMGHAALTGRGSARVEVIAWIAGVLFISVVLWFLARLEKDTHPEL
jgi:membrane protein DedA with SNARE-associated domain